MTTAFMKTFIQTPVILIFLSCCLSVLMLHLCGIVASFLSLHGLQMALVVSELIECPADVADGLNGLVSVKPNTALQ